MPPKKRKVDLNANARQDKKEGTSRTSFTEDTKRESSSGQRQDEGGDGDGAGSSAEAPSELLRLDILGALIQRRCDHIVINILNNLDCTSLVHCCWTSALWRRFLDESANRERTDFAIKEEEFRLREPGLRPVVKELEWMESPLENVNVLRSMDAGEILAAKLPPLPSTPVSGGVYLFNERFFLMSGKGNDRPGDLETFFFVERDGERALEWRRSPLGAPAHYDLFGSSSPEKVAYRDLVVRRKGEAVLRMKADGRGVRPALRALDTTILGGLFNIKRVAGWRERSGKESLLIYGRLSEEGEERRLTFVDWGKEGEEKVLWENDFPAPDDRVWNFEQERTMVRLLLCDGYAGMLSTVHDNDDGYLADDRVLGKIVSMRLRLFSKEDGSLVGDDEVDVNHALGQHFQCGEALESVSESKILALCPVRDWSGEETWPVCRIECYVYDASRVLRGGGGGVARDKSIPRKKVSLRHPLLWEHGPQRGSDLECSLRRGSILVLFMKHNSLSVWDLGSGPEGVPLSTHELSGLYFQALRRDGGAWVFHDKRRDVEEEENEEESEENEKESEENEKEYEGKPDKYLVLTLHKSLGVLGETT